MVVVVVVVVVVAVVGVEVVVVELPPSAVMSLVHSCWAYLSRKTKYNG